MSPSSAASLGSGSVREMPSTTSHANSIWTDLHSVASLTAGASSRVELLDSLRDDEMSCVSMQRAYKDKISKRKRHVNHVDMRKMTGRSSAPKAIIYDLPLFAATPAQTAPSASEPNELKQMLNEILPDELTPREALQKLYELKEALK